MKKSVLLGIVAVTLFSLPALAGEIKYPPGTPWGHYEWVADWLEVCRIPVIMKIPYYVHLTNQDPIEIVQVDCGTIGKNPAKDKDWPCFYGCNETGVQCNFNIKLKCDIVEKNIGGGMSCSVSPSEFDMPGGTANICVKAWNVDLLGKPANEELTVAKAKISVTIKL